MADVSGSFSEQRRRRDTGVLRPSAPHWDGPFYRPRVCGRAWIDRPEQPLNHAMAANQPMISWGYVLRGWGLLRIDGQPDTRLDAGTVFVVRQPSRALEVRVAAGLPWSFLWAGLADAPALELGEHVVRRFGPVHRLPRGTPMERAAVRLLADARAQPHRPATHWSMRAFQLLNGWLEACETHLTPLADLTARAPAASKELDRTPATVKAFAASLGYSRSHLSRMLKTQWRDSPGKLLRLSRLEEAARMLRTTQLPVRDIARRAGYAAHNSFGTAFTKQFGLTPLKYRHQNRR